MRDGYSTAAPSAAAVLPGMKRTGITSSATRRFIAIQIAQNRLQVQAVLFGAARGRALNHAFKSWCLINSHYRFYTGYLRHQAGKLSGDTTKPRPVGALSRGIQQVAHGRQEVGLVELRFNNVGLCARGNTLMFVLVRMEAGHNNNWNVC